MNEYSLIEQIEYDQPLGKRDHLWLKWHVILETKPITRQQEKRNFCKGNYENTNMNLRSADCWPKLLEDNTADDVWQIFKNIMLKQIQDHIPMKDVKRKKKGKWLSSEMIKR